MNTLMQVNQEAAAVGSSVWLGVMALVLTLVGVLAYWFAGRLSDVRRLQVVNLMLVLALASALKIAVSEILLYEKEESQ
jgi:hypothetical protein